ncbi:suppressor of fused domain protein [Williamsia sp. CHRR-6]|uniref:suppressor of fused domain protein n=1 Tax=Williamsia sp. CHRR-6 TaxID=2835871 RepID=UPI001BD9607C|nr:suppressor of fused domain protein [Williamsia sp. CHRR-6]MBT0568458.1 suppressor of fused domain protein [Williamsia sp. CHRR-6]
MSESVVESVAEHLAREFSGSPQRASVTFLGVEPIDVLRFVVEPPGLVYATLGCSRHPMNDPEDLSADPVRGPRAEVVMRIAGLADLPGLHRTLAVVAAAPAVEGLVLSPDALMDIGEPLWAGAAFSAVVLEPDSTPDCPLPEPMSPVRFLRAVPVTANEAAWVRLRGVQALRAAWSEAGIDPADPTRVAADLGDH